jgi:hypothetical protein
MQIFTNNRFNLNKRLIITFQDFRAVQMSNDDRDLIYLFRYLFDV